MKLVGKARTGFKPVPYLAQLEPRLTSERYPLRNLGLTGPQNARLSISDTAAEISDDEIALPMEFGYLCAGDIFRFNPANSEIRVLYRRNSRHNSLFLTERCNSRCLMCSQPPREIDDAYLVDDILRMIPWMSKETSELGITGGEPTLLFGRLSSVIAATKQHLPQTALHMLSNGRMFAYTRYAQEIGSIRHPDFMVGVPLYADTAASHNFVVQAAGAFEQTIFGLLNLARAGVRIELRMVIHKHTYARLPEFARFVARNFPFVDQVALMGLELTGFARSNLEALWIDPVEYQTRLEECVETLDAAGLSVHLFNHPLCVLHPSMHRFARKSISDWKNIYLQECIDCTKKDECGGFFASSILRHSAHLKAFKTTASTINETET